MSSNKILLLCLVLVLTTASLISADDTYCQPVTLGDGSELNPQRTEGGSITMYRLFATEGGFEVFNITWTRQPSDLHYSKGRYILQNQTFTNGTLEASITIWGLTFSSDLGYYNVTVCSNCTCNRTTFFLHLFDCNPSEAVPQPVRDYQKHVIAETSLSTSLPLYVFFNGSTDTFFYFMLWSFEGDEVCGVKPVPSFSCDRTLYGSIPCAFTANLHIDNPSSQNSGNYTVKVIGSQTTDSRVATYVLVIVSQPYISCSEHHITPGKIECTIRNYSQYIEMTVIKDEVILVDKYPASHVCKPYVGDNTQAKCMVQLKSGSFNVCVEYNELVMNTTEPSIKKCSSAILVSIADESLLKSPKLWAPVGGVVAGLVIAVGIFIACYCKRRKENCERQGQVRDEVENEEESSPLLSPSGSMSSGSEEGTNSPRSYTTELQTSLETQQSPVTMVTGPAPLGEEGDRDADRDGVTTVNRDGVTANRDGVTADRDGVTADRDGVTTADRDGVTAGSPHLPIQESMPERESIPMRGPRQLPTTEVLTTIQPHSYPASQVTFIYSQNPVEYERIESIDESRLTTEQVKLYEEEVIQKGRSRDITIKNHRDLVDRFATFISTFLHIKVAFDQQIDDIHTRNKLLWLEERVEESDYAILIITPSFLKFMKKTPDEEIFFHSELISTLMKGLVKKKDGTIVKVFCVFLNQAKNLDHVPVSLRIGHVFELWEPFHTDDESTKAFASLLTGKRSSK